MANIFNTPYYWPYNDFDRIQLRSSCMLGQPVEYVLPSPGLNYNGFVVNNTASNGWYSWKLANGSFINLNITDTSCEIRYAKMLVDQTLVPLGFSCTVGGVSFSKAAIGTPVNLAGGSGSSSFSLGSWGFEYGDSSSFQYSTACAPILISNPIRCRKTGNVTIGTNEVTVEANGCKIISPIFSVDSSLQGATSSEACLDGLDVGNAIIVIGAVNSHVAFSPRKPNRCNFQCSIINGTEQLCTPFPAQSLSTVTNYTLAVGAVAHQQFLTENSYRDGWWETIYDTERSVSDGADPFNSSTGLFKFHNSQNSLEDALGLVSGVVLGAYFGIGFSNAGPLTGRVAIDGIRIGTGQWLALLYIIPEVYATLFILYFLCIRKKRPASGGTITSTS